MADKEFLSPMVSSALKLKSAVNTFVNTLTNATTSARTWTFQDKDYTIAGTDDTHDATSKTTPVDADELPLVDSAASYTLKKLTWSNLKATLKTYFDTIYSTTNTLSGLSASAGTLSSSDTLIQAFNKIAGIIDNAAWQSWTPVTQYLTLGNGTFNCKYKQIGKTVHWRFELTFGSTTAITPGQFLYFKLPVSPKSVASTYHFVGTGTAPSLYYYRLTALLHTQSEYVLVGYETTNALGSGLYFVAIPHNNGLYVAGNIVELSGAYEAA